MSSVVQTNGCFLVPEAAFFHSAEDFRQGVEEKFWLAKRTQAKLYLNQAQGALETVKVSNAILISHVRYI